jgi:cellulose biosynthesis protein BcsQ
MINEIIKKAKEGTKKLDINEGNIDDPIIEEEKGLLISQLAEDLENSLNLLQEQINKTYDKLKKAGFPESVILSELNEKLFNSVEMIKELKKRTTSIYTAGIVSNNFKGEKDRPIIHRALMEKIEGSPGLSEKLCK